MLPETGVVRFLIKWMYGKLTHILLSAEVGADCYLTTETKKGCSGGMLLQFLWTKLMIH